MQTQTTRAATAAQAASSSSGYLVEIFGPDGRLARSSPGYSPRPAQIQLARAADHCFSTGTPTLAEGPCGTGKGLAYLVPGIKHAVATRRRLVIATATNALLEQLLRKELPTLQKVLPWRFTFGEFFGRSNYLCREKEAGFQPSMLHPKSLLAAKALKRFALTTTTGKKDDAPQECLPIWEHVSVTPEECSKPGCKVMEHCYVEKARKRADDVDVIVTNLHMLALNIRYDGAVLPEFDYLVLDEAHELPDIARDFFGERVTWYQAKKMLECVEAAGVDAGDLGARIQGVFEAAVALTTHPVDSMFGTPPRAATEESGVRSARIEQTPGQDTLGLKRVLGATMLALKTVGTRAAEEKKRLGFTQVADEMVAAAAVAGRYAKRFDAIFYPKSENTVRWVEVTHRGTASINGQPVEVGPALRTGLFEKHPSIFVTSATLTTEGSFDFVKREIGAPANTIYEIAPSPFDFKNQAMLCVPKIPAPDVDEEGWLKGVLDALIYTVRALDGRTMALFTSNKRMKAAAAFLREHPDCGERQILVQGEDGSRSLADRFKADERSVLLGTRTFWTGIDAPGDTLCALIIDRLPMLQDTAQLQAMRSFLEARSKKMAADALAKGEKAPPKIEFFSSYYVPKSALLFRQGVGRVIRSVKDIGVVIVCDGRILSKPYGRSFVRSLPEMDISRRLEDIVPFLRHARATVGR